MWIRIYNSLCFKHHNLIFLFMKGYSTSKLVPTNNVTHLVCFAAVFRLVMQRLWGGALRDEPKSSCKGDYDPFATLKERRKLGRVNFRKGFWSWYQGQGENWPIADRLVLSIDPRNTCGTHFGFRSLPVSKLTNSFLIQPFSFGFQLKNRNSSIFSWVEKIQSLKHQ